MERYNSTVTALDALVPTLPNIAALVTTIDDGRRAAIRNALEEAACMARVEQSERRSILRLPLSKRTRAEVSKMTRKGAEFSKHVLSLSDRAEELFSSGKSIPASPALLTAHEERDLFKAFRQYRERFWTAMHMVPFVRDLVLNELSEIRRNNLKVANVVMSPRSKGKGEAQLARHVDANVATASGMLEREHGKPSLLNSAKIATLLVETPLVAERLTQLMADVVTRTEELRVLRSRLSARYGSIGNFAAKKDPEYPLYVQGIEELGGRLEHAELQCRTLKALQEPYQRIKDYIVHANLRLVGKLVTMHEKIPDNQDELMQDGVIGLMRAIEKFDIDTGLKLSTAATWWIRQAIFRKRPTYHHPIALPAHHMEVFKRIVLAEGEEAKPSDRDLSKQFKIEEAAVQALRVRARPVLSISGRDEEERSLGEIIPDRREETVLDGASQLELREKIQMMLRRIHPRYAEILSKRFGLEDAPLTLDQIARQMGITRERVRQLEAKALNKIRGGPLAQMLEEYV